jgi:serine protease AprX
MKYFFSSVLMIGFFFNHTHAQFTRYIIKLKDKNGSPYSISDPTAYLSQRAIDRRTRYSISIDSTDLPVNPFYVTQIKNIPGVTVLNISKWLNAVTIQTADANALNAITGFSFVRSTSGIAAKKARSNPVDWKDSKFDDDFLPIDNSNRRTSKTTGDYYDYGNSFNEIHLHNGEFLHNIGLRGSGMQIALLDNGFNNYTSFDAFDSVNANNQVLGTWDFVAREQNVSDDGSHGMSCFSTIGANIPGQFIGKAPQAKFWLYQTEDNSSEYPIEEFNWVCGAEKADSSGADVISSSLGYATFDDASLNHTYVDMDGNTTMAVIAADLAAKKGVLVFVSNGNFGTSAWHFLSTPADGDSVVAVGAVDASGTVGSFSSYGPSSDGQIKPDVASVGVSAILETSAGTIGSGNGTSFACPNMAGLATCLWQGFPELSNMKIRSALWQSASRADSPDDRMGYGIPDMKKAFVNLLLQSSSANGTISNCKATLNWTSKDVSAMRYEIERKIFGENNYSKIAVVAAQPNTSILSTHSYQKEDNLVNVPPGTVSYRIRQILDTAAATLTGADIDTVNITFNESCSNGSNAGAEKINIIPNPAPGKFTLRVETDYSVNNLIIHILDMKGALVSAFIESKTIGKADFDLQVHKLPKGKYIVAVYDDSRLIASKELIRL